LKFIDVSFWFAIVMYNQKTKTIISEIIITTITKTEIQQLIERAVQKALDQKSANQKNEQDAFLGVEQAASFLGIAKATLYGKCSKLLIPHFKQGKKLYFRQSELTDYLQSGKRKSIQDIQQKVNAQLSQKGKQLSIGM
jgi:predicted DNA-binding transcriptional regulator AlpA